MNTITDDELLKVYINNHLQCTTNDAIRFARAVLALAESKSATRMAVLEMAERQRNVFSQQANEYAEEARALRARIARLEAQAAQHAQAPLSEQDAGLLNQAHELLECYSAEMRLRGNDSAANGAECSADAILRLFKLAETAQVASLADIDVPTTFKLAGESDEQWIDRITGGKPAQVAAPEPVQQQAPKQWVDAVELAYGWLWNINSEPMAPIPLVDAERAAARARLALLPLLTRTQQWIGIGQVKSILVGEMSAPKREGGA